MGVLEDKMINLAVIGKFFLTFFRYDKAVTCSIVVDFSAL